MRETMATIKGRSPMSSVPAIALSGLKAAQADLDGAAHRIARLATSGVSGPDAAVAARADGTPAEAAGSVPPLASLAGDLVDQWRAQHAFAANLAVFRSSDAMMGALLDLHA